MSTATTTTLNKHDCCFCICSCFCFRCCSARNKSLTRDVFGPPVPLESKAAFIAAVMNRAAAGNTFRNRIKALMHELQRAEQRQQAGGGIGGGGRGLGGGFGGGMRPAPPGGLLVQQGPRGMMPRPGSGPSLLAQQQQGSGVKRLRSPDS